MFRLTPLRARKDVGSFLLPNGNMSDTTAREGNENGSEADPSLHPTEGKERILTFQTTNGSQDENENTSGSWDEIESSTCSSVSLHEESSSGDERMFQGSRDTRSGYRGIFIPKLSAIFDCLSASKPRSSRTITPRKEGRYARLSGAESSQSSQTPEETRRRISDAYMASQKITRRGRVLGKLDGNLQCLLIQPSPHVEKHVPVQQAADPIKKVPTCSKDVVFNLLASKRRNRSGAGHHHGKKHSLSSPRCLEAKAEETACANLSRKMDGLAIL